LQHAEDVAARLQVVKDYAMLVNAVHEHKELLFSYGQGCPHFAFYPRKLYSYDKESEAKTELIVLS
jgi:hypothetical protein